MSAAPSPLTDRETEVLAAAGPDTPIRDVARAVFLSPGTVRNYLSAITAKLGTTTRADRFPASTE
ncbi:hypothetical protein Aple_072490 [Acrocarpospora pleiomorpha]|uniref:HTH luxR-type domain-containing protein n=1 Tax=Acrocarpospora pleiomorpha TaxID=90975 RepID=A0A5M3XTZ5_9ACTN|nr:hypothetical protein Aple_072490 [Acrocarpospora pleiomorpha]